MHNAAWLQYYQITATACVRSVYKAGCKPSVQSNGFITDISGVVYLSVTRAPVRCRPVIKLSYRPDRQMDAPHRGNKSETVSVTAVFPCAVNPSPHPVGTAADSHTYARWKPAENRGNIPQHRTDVKHYLCTFYTCVSSAFCVFFNVLCAFICYSWLLPVFVFTGLAA